MYLTQWNPFEKLTSLQDEVDRLFRYKQSSAQESGVAAWCPAVDIHEDTEAFHFDVEVPGVDKNGLDIKIEDRVLKITGERKNVSEEKRKNYHRIERDYGCFSRAFTLPETADPEHVNAQFTNGILKVKIAKKEQAKPKQIEIQVS
ncbi:MAG: Hsp20/alpha crystallin family protein [bacterium]|nr:Hsp20/alpha crystallin family protein [bacterium]MBU1917562.1 Hsp20/alpha crystallin family protein [bacterium]